MPVIAVIAAMEEELAGFVKASDISREIRFGPVVLREAGLTGALGRTDLLLCVSGIGKVLTAAAVQYCIARYSPDAVIHTGIAGGLVFLPRGDILVAESSIQWDFDARPFVKHRGEIPRTGMREISADPDLFRAVTALRPKGFRIHSGRIVTGDSVITRKNHEAYRFLTEELRGSAVDMESAAAAIVAEINGIRFLSFKVISDDADGSSPPLFRRFVRKSSEKCVPLAAAAADELVRTESPPR